MQGKSSTALAEFEILCMSSIVYLPYTTIFTMIKEASTVSTSKDGEGNKWREVGPKVRLVNQKNHPS